MRHVAKSSKIKTGKSVSDAKIEDDVEVPEAETADVSEEADHTVSVQSVDEVPNDEDGLDPASDDPDDADLEMEIVEDPVEPAEVAEPSVAPIEPKSSSGGFFPLLLGGVAAGAIGYGIATYYPMNSGATDEALAQVAAQAERIEALEAMIESTPSTDLSGIEAQIVDLGEATATQISDLNGVVSGQISEIDARLLEVEKRPGADGTLSDTALAAYQRELEELRAELDAQQASVLSAAAQAEADLAAARAEAEQLEQQAVAAAEAAAARAALNRIAASVETGASFADALADLGASDVPAALSAAANEGVATSAQLVSDFPEAARAALATARAEGVSDDASGLGGFLRSQFDVRSTAPREGAGPDAVLSRAEAAVKDGRISDALAEIEALPEVARAELTDWTARATMRADVLDAIASLSETYN